jgi:hypothetical protein
MSKFFWETALKNVLCVVLCVACLMQLTACGTMMYPERRGQRPELARLDTTVIIMDGVLLFLFVLPGVIAYAVDFSTGCVYLPAGQISDNLETDLPLQVKVIQLDPNLITLEAINQAVQEQTGIAVSRYADDLMMFKPTGARIDVAEELERLQEGFAPLAEGIWFEAPQVPFMTIANGRLF